MSFVAKYVLKDNVLGIIVPVIVYWVYAGTYHLLDSLKLKALDKHRLHSRSEEKNKNAVTVGGVVKGVIVQQLLQFVAGTLLFWLDPTSQSDAPVPDLKKQAICFLIAMFVMDTWQYFMHRLMHESRFLYRHLHSWHHRLLVPYAFGALYNHPVEGLILDTMGGAVSFLLSGMHPRTAVFFFSFATMKTIDDHCGLIMPGNPFQFFFKNNAAYHDIHHQLSGFRYNYSQPFFPIWDMLLGTYMPYTLERVPEGLQARALKQSRSASEKTD